MCNKKLLIFKTIVMLASDDCQVGEYSAWGDCTGSVCGGSGKQYRQRYYKNPDKATKCHRKLFETKTCIMPRCTYGTQTIHIHTILNYFLLFLCDDLFSYLFLTSSMNSIPLLLYYFFFFILAH